MSFSFPVRRFLQGTTKTETPDKRFGRVEWVLARPMYRFQTVDLSSVPAKSRAQALRLELAQWTPYKNTSYYIGWHAQKALVWGWDADKVNQALLAQGLKLQQVKVLPETVLHPPLSDGLCVTQCSEGFEMQLWRHGRLEHNRWLAQAPTPEEWLMFQRDAGTPPSDQQDQTPTARRVPLNDHAWISEGLLAGENTRRWERLAITAITLVLLAPTLWFGFSLLKLQQIEAVLRDQRTQLLADAAPLAQARSQALEFKERSTTLLALNTYPSQTQLMATIAELLPKDNSYLKGWDYQQGQLKITLASVNDVSTTFIIGALQQAGPFSDVKAVPGRDPKSVTFEMTVKGK